MKIKWTASVGLKASKFLLSNPKALGPMVKYIIGWSKEIRDSYNKASNLEAEIMRLVQDLDKCEEFYKKGTNNNQEDRWYTLYKLIRDAKPDTVVETGVAAGVSTAHILRALSINSKGGLYSIDLPNQFYLTSKNIFHAEFNPPGQQSGYLIPYSLKARWYLTTGLVEEKLPKILSELDKIDIFIHDSKHTYKTQMFEMIQAWPHIREDGYLIVDDASWSTAFRDFCKVQLLIGEVINGQGFLKKTS